MQKELVVAAFDRDLSWLNDVDPSVTTTVYRKGSDKAYKGEIQLPINKGRCVHTFFNHLYERYDSLADVTFFVQDYPFDHFEHLLEVLKGDNFYKHATLSIGGYHGFHWNSIKVHSEKGGLMWDMYPTLHHGEGNILACNKYGQPQWNNPNMNLDLFWAYIFSDPIPDRYEFIPGGHFSITREHAQLRPREFYKKIVDLLLHYEDYPWIIERFECYIFNPKYTIWPC